LSQWKNIDGTTIVQYNVARYRISIIINVIRVLKVVEQRINTGGAMSITIPLEKMSIEEKIQAMESIWDDLCNKADSIASPSWHKELLDEREEGIKRGLEWV